MKIEKAIKIQLEIKLLEGGYYDEDVWKYVNEHIEKYEKAFDSVLYEKKDNIRHRTNNQPNKQAVRTWWFRECMHPELFKVKNDSF